MSKTSGKRECDYGHTRVARKSGAMKCPSCLRVGNLMRRTGMTREAINAILQTEPDRCELCGQIGPVYFDHDHETGQFRGWLCHWCNVGIGAFLDSPALLSAARHYLRRPRVIRCNDNV